MIDKLVKQGYNESDIVILELEVKEESLTNYDGYKKGLSREERIDAILND